MLLVQQGRQLIWAWLQEFPSPLSHDYAGCISLPRQLQLGAQKRKLKHVNSTSYIMCSTQSSEKQQQQEQQHDAADGSRGSIAGALADSTGDAAVHGSATGGTTGQGDTEVVEYFLRQTPLPELANLRSGRGLRLKGIRLPAGQAW
jgi:sucrose-6-phosphate hydrolase SacC (GH32 family)